MTADKAILYIKKMVTRRRKTTCDFK